MSDNIILKVSTIEDTFNLPILKQFLSNFQFDTIFTRQYTTEPYLPEFDFLYTKYMNFSQKVFTNHLQELLKNHDFFCELVGSQNLFWIVKINHIIIISLLLPYELFVKLQTNIENTMNHLFQNRKAISGYIGSTQDLLETSKLKLSDSYRRLQHSKYNNCSFSKNELWNNLLSDDIWFPACWHMWLNCYYIQEYKNILALPFIYKTTPLCSNIYHIQLHKHYLDYKHYSCILFKSIVQNLKSTITKTNYTIHIQEHLNRTILQITQFYDSNNHLTTEENATFKEISNFLILDQTNGTLLSKKKHPINS